MQSISISASRTRSVTPTQVRVGVTDLVRDALIEIDCIAKR